MISDAAQYILNLTDSPGGISKEKIKDSLVALCCGMGGGFLTDKEFEEVFSEAERSGQMTEYDGIWYSNERYKPRESFFGMH